jgi:hypothetical protein
MKKSELRQLIREELNRLNEGGMMLHFVQDQLPSGTIANNVSVSDYKSIDKIRGEMIKILQKKDQPYTLAGSIALIKQAAKNLGIDESKLQEADEYIGHAKILGDTLYVDSNLLNKLNSLNLSLNHIGFGDFETKKPLKTNVGDLYMSFYRVSKDIPDFVGRSHEVRFIDDDSKSRDELPTYKALLTILKQKGII